MSKKRYSKPQPISAIEKKINILSAKLDEFPEEILFRAEELLKTNPTNISLLIFVAEACLKNKKTDNATTHAESALKIESNNIEALNICARIELYKNNTQKALSYLKKSENEDPENKKTILLLLHTLLKLKNFDEILLKYNYKNIDNWSNSATLNNYAQCLLEIGKIDEAIDIFEKSIRKNPEYYVPYANRIVAMHYSIKHSPSDILEACFNFQKKIGPKGKIDRAKSKSLRKDKKLRIGMISGGFCSHPVGSMITNGLSYTLPEEIEFFLYSTGTKIDHITEKLKKKSTKWVQVENLSDKFLNKIIREDDIDILFDLSGFNDNSRITTIMMKPAPIIVKWVGGLISSTGLEAVDYLLSDRIQTPIGSDDLYTEKLIRLPDDYICYEPPLYSPPVEESPWKKNNHITFGCFNNASKINDITLENWAKILNSVPNSKIFLKSHGFNSSILCEYVLSFFNERQIDKSRVRLEGPSPHVQLLQLYNEVDIALDPWPYSGGLTTCEALIMGVPVITYPGSTFAGRHSATHLVNAGLPELIADDWNHYQRLAINLANDLDNLSTIRQNLRFIVLQSNLCNAPRFSRSFSNAMRAIWQRHCEGKDPESLVLSDEQIPYFADQLDPVKLELPAPVLITENEENEKKKSFTFNLNRKILTIDNGTNIEKRRNFLNLLHTKAYSFILFDPAGLNTEQQLPIDLDNSIEHLPYHILEQKEKTKLYATLDPVYSSTLEPINNENENKLGRPEEQKRLVIAEIPIFSVNPNRIANIDWLILNGRHDLLSILNKKSKSITESLVIQINLPDAIEHKNQADISSLSQHMSMLGFDLYKIEAEKKYDYFEKAPNEKEKLSPTRPKEYSLLFIPNNLRLQDLGNNELEKLAFILHSAYKIQDFAYHVLSIGCPDRGALYLDSLTNNEEKHVDIGPKKHIPTENSNISIPDIPAMSQDEIKLFSTYLKKSKSYFEYGTGGSSKLAASLGLTINGIESDQKWLNQLMLEIGKHNFQHVDIGPTKEWGYPVDLRAKERFHLYSSAIHNSGESYDLILVDGRFRVACALHAAKHIIKHQTQESSLIFIHDFWGREYYQPILEFLEEVKSVDSAAVFQVKKLVDQDKLNKSIKQFEEDVR